MFIFALLVAAIQLILGNSKTTESTIKNVIIIALFINFSLFICRVVIDGGNILARQFYNNISVTEGDEPGAEEVQQGGQFTNSYGLVKKKSLSLGLAKGMSLQNLITQGTIDAMKRSGLFNAYTLTLLFVLGIIINATAAWILLIGGLLFFAPGGGPGGGVVFSPGAFFIYLLPCP